MEYTQNYALRKPGLNEYANVGDLNYNSDKIDSQMKKNQDVDGEVYDPTSTSANAYEAGDYVINPDDGLMYVCNGTTYGTWDATKWDHTTEFEEIQKAMASGGESELADLHDVDITNPTEGQVLTYDEQNDEWVNSDLPDADVTKTASGNPIEFSDGADAPLVKCVTEIQGSQDLHGYDKPWVGGAGKNKLPLSFNIIKTYTTGTWVGNTYYYNGITFTIYTDEGGDNVTAIKATGTATSSAFFMLYKNLYLDSDSIINGCPFDGGDNSYFLDAFTTRSYRDSGAGISIPGNTNYREIYIGIRSGYSIPEGGLLFYPMIRLATVADPTFAPYSNICPITAYTEGEIEVAKSYMEPSISLGSFFIDGNDSTTNDRCRTEFISTTVGSKYKFSVKSTDSTKTAQIYVFWSNNNVKGYSTLISGGEWGNDFEAVCPIGYPYMRILLRYSDNSVLTVDSFSDFTVRQDSTTHTTTYPSAIYRGSEDVVGESATCNWPVIDLGNLTWYKSGSMFYSEGVTDFKRGAPYNNRSYANAICSHYSYGINDDPDATITLYYDSASSLYRLWVNDPTKASMTTADFKTAMSGVQFAYELATPTTSSVTPTNLPIKSLFGYNHIESSTGDMEIEYFPQKEQPLIDLIPEASNMHEYSTAEHAVGTWIDGETIYEQSIDLGSFSIGSGGTYIIEEATDIDLLIDYDGYVIESSIMYALPDPSIRIKMESNKDLIFSGTANWDVTSGYLTIRYTKTSSNNRSLAKSAPQEEIKEEQVEELKEEPTEETKEEPEEVKEEPVEEVKEEETKEEGEVNER